MTPRIQQIHESDVRGIFIEMGLGNPVSTKLCEVPGASNTVFYSENPYNDKLSRKLYGIEGRIVSLEAVHKIMTSDRIDDLYFADSKNNTVLVSSFQIGNQNDKSTHGYVGLSYKGETRYYHLSIHLPLERWEYIQYIRDTCLKLLSMNGASFKDSFIDGVWDAKLNSMYERTFDFMNHSPSSFAYISNGKILRLEDLLRSAEEGLIIYKGSFNPITNAHLKIKEEASKLRPNYKTVFSISLNTFDKGLADHDNLAERIRLIEKCGHGVLIYTNPRFDAMHEDLLLKYNKEIMYVMGVDTSKRYMGSPHNLWLKNRKFIEFSRKGYPNNVGFTRGNPDVIFMELDLNDSSTMIRNAIRENKLHEVTNMIPNEIYDDLIDNVIIRGC